MKKVLIIGRQKVGEKNDAKLLAKGLTGYASEYKVESVYYEDILMFCGNEKLDFQTLLDGAWQELNQFDLVILINWSHDRLYSDLAHLIAAYCQSNSIGVWNSELINARPMTKVAQLYVAAKNDVPIPDTLFCLSLHHLLHTYEKYLEFPFVAKDPTASRGRRNFLINNHDDLESLGKEDYPMLFQQYIKNDASDLRVIVAAGKPVFAFKRKGKEGSHLNNISAGGSAEKLEIGQIPPEVAQYSIKLAKSFKKELCGIDFMFDFNKNHFIFLEINTTPQLINGVFAEDKLKALSEVLSEREG